MKRELGQFTIAAPPRLFVQLPVNLNSLVHGPGQKSACFTRCPGRPRILPMPHSPASKVSVVVPLLLSPLLPVRPPPFRPAAAATAALLRQKAATLEDLSFREGPPLLH